MVAVSTTELRHSATVPAPPAAIFDHLSRPESYLGLSPLLVAVRDVHVTPDEVRYVTVERFRLGPLHWDNPIRVTMTFPAPGRTIHSDVRSPGRVHLVATVEFEPEGDGTRVTESVRVSYPRLLRRFVVGQATAVQRHRLAELGRRFSARSAGRS